MRFPTPGGAPVLRTINLNKLLKQAFSGKPCKDIRYVRILALDFWWHRYLVPQMDDRSVFLNALHSLRDTRTRAFRIKPVDDRVEFLNALHALPDTRN